jgi:hypothetical protein
MPALGQKWFYKICAGGSRKLEANAQTIFDQAENRLHIQKAILADLVS